MLAALGWRDQEVALPAYTCVVMAHAITLSGNRVRFIDSAVDHFLAPTAALAAALSPATKMVLPTPLFGYPFDRPGYEQIIRRSAPGAMVVVDLAHAFGIEDAFGSQADGADAAIFGLGIGKQISTLFGGMLLLRDKDLHAAVRQLRDRTFRTAPSLRTAKLFLYGVAATLAFREPLLTPTDFLERRTPLLHGATEYYYGKSGPTLPADAWVHPTSYQARLGLRQLSVYDEIITRRRELSYLYQSDLTRAGFSCFAVTGIPTFSHFPLPVADRQRVMDGMRRAGIQLGCLIDYACPDLPGYRARHPYCPNASWFGRHMINLPNWPGMRHSAVHRVVDELVALRDAHPEWFETPSSLRSQEIAA